MTRSMRWTLLAALVPVALLLIVLGYYDEARKTLMAPVLLGAAGGLPAIWSLYAMGQKLDALDLDHAAQEHKLVEVGGRVGELRATVEKQLGAIEETAASLHQMTA